MVQDFCPYCDYHLTGLPQPRCPECGHALDLAGPPRLLFRQGFARSLARASWSVVRHPIRTLDLCRWPQAVPSRTAAAFAGSWMTFLVLGWPIIRRVVATVSYCTVFGPAEAFRSNFGTDSLRRLLSLQGWILMLSWHAGAVLRWWLLFGFLIVLIGLSRRTTPPSPAQRSRASEALARMLLFAPWIAIIEIGYLIGAYVDTPNVVPEPSTVYITTWHWDGWLHKVWLLRGIAPTLGVGYIFFRAVARWPARAALPAAILLIPVAINLSLAWSWVWIHAIERLLP